MSELLNTYHKNKRYKSIATRVQVHQQGEWHETFQCIFKNGDDIFLQKRSMNVNDYKGMFDVTVGGHILYDETIEDGIREIKEEMGIEIDFEVLEFLCTIPEEMYSDVLIDREFISIFTVEVTDEEINRIQHDEEVEYLLKVNKRDFYNLCINNAENCTGRIVTSKQEITFTKMDFLPYSEAYFMCVGAMLCSDI